MTDLPWPVTHAPQWFTAAYQPLPTRGATTPTPTSLQPTTYNLPTRHLHTTATTSFPHRYAVDVGFGFVVMMDGDG